MSTNLEPFGAPIKINPTIKVSERLTCWLARVDLDRETILVSLELAILLRLNLIIQSIFTNSF